MMLSLVDLSYIVSLCIILLIHFIYRWRNPKCNGKLPPGSSGIPFIGESLELFIPSYTIDVQPFIKKRLQKYGTIFRTNIAGRNVVVSGDPEINRYIFQQEERLVVHWYLDAFAKIFKQEDNLRPDSLVIHKYTRNLSLGHFGHERIKQKLLSRFEELVRDTLQRWSTQDSVEFKSAFVSMYGTFGAKQLYSCEPENAKALTDKLFNVTKGALSFPWKIPGTSYHKCLEDKKKLLKIIKDIVQGRLAKPEDDQDDLLGKLIKDMNKEKFINEDFIIQLLFGLSFTTFETIPSILTFTMKFISEHPDVLQELIVEHEEILKKRTSLDTPLMWEMYKSMTFTLHVVHESLRLVNIMPGLLRKSVKDIQVKGYTIPAGWGIMICHSVQHLDPSVYEDPLKFNPWRWKDVAAESVYNNLIPFGGGIKQCAGADFARVSMCVFLHVLVTKYRWMVVEGGDVIQNPVMHLKNGLHINIFEK